MGHTALYGQAWGDWIDVGYGIQVSFKFGKRSCTFANTYARIRNISSSKYCSVNVVFHTVCDNSTNEMSISANKLAPTQIKESPGDWYVTSLQVFDIRLSQLTDEKCRRITLSNTGGTGGNTGAGQPGNFGSSVDQSGDFINVGEQPKGYQPPNEAGNKAAWEILKAKDEKEKQDRDARQKATDENRKKQEALNRQQINTAQQQQQKLQQLVAEQQQRYQQTQMDLTNAQTAANSVYDAAIAGGKKTSGALLDATMAGAREISDPKAQLAYTGVGLAVTLFAHLGEKKQERLEKEAAARREEERKQALIEAKGQFIEDAIQINKYQFSDLVSKGRYAALLIAPISNSAEEESIYFSSLAFVPPYEDGSHPLKDEVQRKLLLSLNQKPPGGYKVYTLYPVINIDKFQDEFIKKMASGHLIGLPCELLSFTRLPFETSIPAGSDFWGEPAGQNKAPAAEKKEKEKKQEDFWNN
ncbi:hypothetical protein [Chitinophaga sp. 212800010-3]|uniref:hypothetical protein n=1 Tax=unclassified Chitinophaga TaxID=2619133 RepID=UPI002E0DC5F7